MDARNINARTRHYKLQLGYTQKRGGIILILHRILSIVMVAIAALAIATSVSLITLTTYLHRTTTTLESDAHTIRLVEEMEVDLLTHAHSNDGVLRANTAWDLLHNMNEVRRYVADGVERATLDEAQKQVGIYLEKTTSLPLKE